MSGDVREDCVPETDLSPDQLARWLRRRFFVEIEPESHDEDRSMQPRPDGYAVRVTLKTTNPAILADGGVGDSQRSCGGLLVQFDGLARRYAKRP